MERINHWIDNQPVPSMSGRTQQVFNPALGEVHAEVDIATPEEVDLAVASAKKAFPAWRESSMKTRTDIFFKMRELMDKNRKELTRLVTLEHGKCMFDAASEVDRGVELIEYAAGIPQLLKGEYSYQVSQGVDMYSFRQPLGVVAGITPFNFPVMVPFWMFPNAIACGNCFILKPPGYVPSATMLAAELWKEAGLPAGVFNIVQGEREAVQRILEHPDVDAVSFVGSTPVAKHVQQEAVKHGKRVQALAGAKNHMIVLPDADIGMAADAAVSAGYGSAGERCMAQSIVVAVGDIADDLIAAIMERAPKVKVGSGFDPTSEMGPVYSAEHRERIAGYVRNAPSEGATVLIDGTACKFEGNGFFIGVSLIDNVTTDMKCYQDEIFGPVLGVMRVKTYDEAIKLCRENRWGNGSAIFTRDGGAARRYQLDIDAGMVGINVPIPVPVACHSFGGWKDSLFGDHHMYGPEGIRFYTKYKVVTTRWPDPSTSMVDLGFPKME